jgi:hypothetical protein
MSAKRITVKMQMKTIGLTAGTSRWETALIPALSVPIINIKADMQKSIILYGSVLK